MPTSYTPLLELPKHDPGDPFDITLINEMADLTDAAMGQAFNRAGVRSLLINNTFRTPVNQRRQSSYSGVGYGIDGWFGRVGAQTVTVRSQDVTVTSTGLSFPGIRQKVENIAQYAGKTITFVCNLYASVVPRIAITDATGKEIAGVSGTKGLTQTLLLSCPVPEGVTPDDFVFTILLNVTASGDYMRLYWADAYPGVYTLAELPAHQPMRPAEELLVCQRYLHVYASEAARPGHGLDCCPPMRADTPSQGTLTAGGVTYYYNAAEL